MEKHKQILKTLEWNKENIQEEYNFGTYKIASQEVFITTKYSFGFVNYRPILPGHILVSPLKIKKKYNELEMEEIIDLHLLGNFLCFVIGKLYNTDCFTVTIQDGKYAGQTVEHVHIHIIPRKKDDYKQNDNIYKDLEKTCVGYGRNIICDYCNHTIYVTSQIPRNELFDLEEFKVTTRSPEDMMKEAALIRSYINEQFS